MWISEEEAYELALCYRYKYALTNMISIDTLKKYQQAINKKIENIDKYYHSNNYSDFYITVMDENNQAYALINPYVKEPDYYSKIINLKPYEILLASQQNDILKIINLKKENGQIVNLNSDKSRILTKNRV